ncbi:hypothetical protein AMTRI_Chr02g266510 [Amborella trichopoda]|uniref:Protein kinase domain-containing protein n=1 Tax=Amborella trichopoda TaxID=13333 RepID=W1P316_AMBTC|nr:probable receptor-like protein kinase At4g39110 [Amborella trichopoda]ERN01981.1 hypothetical protein AMTR_s00045p00071050 [Amborella trichopoda]|eukprot:XP_006840306.3 probable receptor-like protein kinase At4g39110 [Amborella trichopoda]
MDTQIRMVMVVVVVVVAVVAGTMEAALGSVARFEPADSYLLDCGAQGGSTKADDGRIFKSDTQSTSFLSTPEDIQASANGNASSPLYQSARIFTEQSTYTFFVSQPGRHWVRLYFLPIHHPYYNLSDAVFSVTTDRIVLLHNFAARNVATPVFKEYLVNLTSESVSLTFTPTTTSIAFINAIEIVSAPDALILDDASALTPVGADFGGLSQYALEVVHRLNVGGPLITPKNDTLSRTWAPDSPFLAIPSAARNVSVSPGIITYPEGVSPLLAPNWVYASAQEMAESGVAAPNFNITWELPVDTSFSYLLRLHFCDIVSKSLNDLYFNVYVNGRMATSGLDLSTLTSALAVPYYKDLVVNASALTRPGNMLRVQVGPMGEGSTGGTPNAILNGLEVMKMSNSAGSLDGWFSVEGSRIISSQGKGSGSKLAAGVGLAMALGAIAGVGAMVFRWYRRPQDWEKRNSFSSWLLPLHAGGHSSFMTTSQLGSHKSGYSNFYSSTLGLGRYFTFAELQEATHGFDDKVVLGVGGFGKVYLGDLDDGTKVAVKRGNPRSEQGINEFQTEIQMLSKLRHRHLVSLIGYCDEQSEMILVYEYMANGPLRDHLYGSGLGPLSWKQRLEVCIGAARGLHYLHTGAAQGIIHRDVKTTNILLDENLVAKVSDFGLSKTAPTLEQTHVSTAVKGSFGYLDPEYFRRQQLTDKSDVYSFGVVLFEVLCARPAINPALPREQVNLAEWALQWHRKGLLQKIIDPHVIGSINAASLKKYVEAAEKCLADYGVDRPSMGDVLWNLEYALQLQEAASSAVGEDDPSANHILHQQRPPTVLDTTAKGSHSRSSSDDESGPTLSSPMFAQMAGCQGR